MRHLSTYVHAHATVQLDDGEKFVAHDGGYDLEIFEVRWSGERFEGTGRIILTRGRMGDPSCVQLRAQDVPLEVRKALAAGRLDAARTALTNALRDDAELATS